MRLQADTVLSRNLLKTYHLRLQLIKCISLLGLELFCAHFFFLKFAKLFVEVSKARRPIIDLLHGLRLIIALSQMVEAMLTLNLLVVQQLAELLLPNDLFLRLLQMSLQADEEFRVAHFFKALSKLCVLSQQIRHCLVSVYYLLVSGADPVCLRLSAMPRRRLRKRHADRIVRHSSGTHCGLYCITAAEEFSLSQGFMVHLLDQLIDVVAHGLQLIPQLLVLILEITFFRLIVCHALDYGRGALHLGEAIFSLHQRLLNESIWVALFDSAKSAFGQLRGSSHNTLLVVVGVHSVRAIVVHISTGAAVIFVID